MAQINEGLLRTALSGLEFERSRIEAAIAEIEDELRSLGHGRTASPAVDAGGGASVKKRTMSASAKKRIAAAQRKRWALQKSGQSEPAKAKRHMSAAGRARIIAATKKRWAAYRKAKASA